MISTAVTPNDVSIVDALWTLINPLKQSAKELLALRLKESLVSDTRQESQAEEISMSEAMDFVNTLSACGKQVVPNDEDGIGALIDEKNKIYNQDLKSIELKLRAAHIVLMYR